MTGHRSVARFDHPALLYRGEHEYVAGCTAFVHSAVAEGEPVLVAVPGTNLELMREALADVADRVVFADMAVAGRNPGRIIPRVLLTFAADHPGRRVSIIGEPIWQGRTALEYPACAAHEALINAAFAGRDAAILCPYDVERLDPSMVEDAWRTHPTMIEFGGHRASDRYADPFETASTFNHELPAPPPDAEFLVYGEHSSLAAVRYFVRRLAAASLSADATEELVLAANELAANTIEHTSGRGRITIWTEHGTLVCQVDDAGHLSDPLAGRLLPSPDRQGGYGLILTNDLCDLVRIYTTPTTTTIRLHKYL
ncbi:anti-sigma factor RsbA family regulatory protein [Couchioplanes caeruleus]|uniref:Anti-sigma regulatory factor n=2 Tax=Couchioplanes caeruleus TaxID=56438 RepID=A0A1K0FTE9_9ACTN|nr:anti-sigma factor RsbA family regulatory protein [Couchioplanes caeruleus]OJF16085.1 anti-sigma regulatory factor [Couchioplanes caeruleus subsp. caeruleus]ROP29982.1 anti-sigma regulatory factor (Ser/Thr protein kinase) [Couchioplanes caeruleus]